MGSITRELALAELAVIPSTQNGITTTTFGPLDKYVAANDNFAGAPRFGESGGFVGESTLLTGGQYIGLTRSQGQQHHRNFIESTEAWRASTDRVASGLAALGLLDGYIYLGSPYAKYHAGMDEAARLVTAAAGKLMAMGLRIYCPIAHGHAVTRLQELPRTWDFWKDQDQPLIDGAAGLIVLTMDGWQESVGLTYEIASFLVANKPMLYLTPADLGVEEMGRMVA